MKTERDQVYRAIDSEREYQASHWPCNDGAGGEPVREISGELLMIEEYVARARTAWTNSSRAQETRVTTDILRKIAAIAVRAMEHHGAPGREGYGAFVTPVFAPDPGDDIPF